jgi:putative addiction module component (TIGR02574 family)
MVAKNLLENVLALPVAERLELASRIWESVKDTPEAQALPDWQKEMLDERLRDMEENPDDEVSWEDVEAELRKRK